MANMQSIQNLVNMPEPESVRVLEECKALQLKKSQDYQNPASSVKQAHHYRRGVATIFDMIDQKMRRAQSIIETMEASPLSGSPNFESLEDTFKDIINYSSFAVSYMRGKMSGQDPTKNALNKPRPIPHTTTVGTRVQDIASPATAQFLTEKGYSTYSELVVEPQTYIHERETGDHGC